jgi:hypothetical protein
MWYVEPDYREENITSLKVDLENTVLYWRDLRRDKLYSVCNNNDEYASFVCMTARGNPIFGNSSIVYDMRFCDYKHINALMFSLFDKPTSFGRGGSSTIALDEHPTARVYVRDANVSVGSHVAEWVA